jgi:hypothetical protein
MQLNIQGPACTVCQFGLSFAGALQAALPALRSRSIDLALVGAVEQAYDGLYAFRKHPLATDEQPEMMKHSCAVFFAISREPDARYPKISGPVWTQTPPSGHDAAVASGSVCPERRCYAGHMAEQALDLAFACAPASQSGTITCLIRNRNYMACAHGHKPESPYAGIILQCL